MSAQPSGRLGRVVAGCTPNIARQRNSSTRPAGPAGRAGRSGAPNGAPTRASQVVRVLTCAWGRHHAGRRLRRPGPAAAASSPRPASGRTSSPRCQHAAGSNPRQRCTPTEPAFWLSPITASIWRSWPLRSGPSTPASNRRPTPMPRGRQVDRVRRNSDRPGGAVKVGWRRRSQAPPPRSATSQGRPRESTSSRRRAISSMVGPRSRRCSAVPRRLVRRWPDGGQVIGVLG